MNSYTVVEILLVLVIIIFQTRFAIITKQNINALRELLPSRDFFFIKKIRLTSEQLNKFDPAEILNGKIYLNEPQWEESDVDENDIILVCPGQSYQAVFDDILMAINVYLLRNKGAAADFNLVKDIVERYSDTEEEEINSSITVPLYLGLMGTMIGIVFGLISLFVFSTAGADPDIKTFLSGISIAMFSSFWGLVCTVYNSNFNFKTAKRSLQKAKNDFYTFVQTHLLPLLNQSVSSSVYTLHQNLVAFSADFSANLSKLASMMTKNHDALIAQDNILRSLDDMNITAFANANIIILKELKSSTGQLQKFGDYLNSLNFMASKTAKLSASFEELLSRTNNFESLAQKLDRRVEESNRLAEFLGSYFDYMHQRGELTKESVVKVEDVMLKSLKQLEEHVEAKVAAMTNNTDSFKAMMEKSLNQLEEHTQAKIEAIKQLAKKEEDLLTQTFADNRSQISKLSLLEDLNKAVLSIQQNTSREMQTMNSNIQGLKNSLSDSNIVLKDISNKTGRTKDKKTKWSLKNLFKPKKKAA